MKQFILNLYKRNIKNPSQMGIMESIEGDSLIEICGKFPLIIIQIQQKIHEDEILELRMKNDDIPF